MEKEIFAVKGGVLAVSGEASLDDASPLAEAMAKLMDSKEKEITLNFERVEHISSSVMSFIVSQHFEAEKKGKKLTVMIGAGLEELFDRTRLRDLVGMNVIVVGAPKRGRERK